MKIRVGGSRAMKGSQDLPLEGFSELRREVRLLRTLLLDLLLAQSRGEPVELSSAELKSVLGLSEGASEDDVVQRILRERAAVVEQLPCPECGGMVNHREGLENVECHWCGATVVFAVGDRSTDPG